MDINRGLSAFIQLGIKFVQHKVLQYWLSTSQTEDLRVAEGAIRGAKRRTVYGHEYWAFEGIPYAQPPLGELRFCAPRPAVPWTGVKDCTRCRSKPLQVDLLLRRVEGSEDCLYLNVYVKQLSSSQPLPVMVWIYGGGFQIGEASRDFYSPDYFMRDDVNVVLVTLNYRLGPLGFLSLDDPDVQVPGNAGLKDQILALRWINQNIAQFGGDANNITLFGMSAGSASVHCLMLSSQAEGLFHKAIMQSGTVLCPWALQTQPRLAYRLARELGYNGSCNDKEVFRFVTQQKGSQLTRAGNNLLGPEEKRDFQLFAFVPVVEPYVSSDCVLAKEPLHLMRTAWGNRIPLIMGSCSFEGLFSYQVDRELLKDLGDCARLVPREVKTNLSASEIKEMGGRLRVAHFGAKKPGAEESFFQFLDLMSYKNFLHGIHRAYLSRVAFATRPTFLYRFDFDSPTGNHFRNMTCDRVVRGTSHADDMFYMFYAIPSSRLEAGTKEGEIMQRMVAMWTSFATHSDPNCMQIAPAVWKAARGDDVTPKCLNINERVDFIAVPELEKLRVWNSLYEKQDLY